MKLTGASHAGICGRCDTTENIVYSVCNILRDTNTVEETVVYAVCKTCIDNSYYKPNSLIIRIRDMTLDEVNALRLLTC